MDNKDLEKEVTAFTPDDDLDLFFNDFIKKGSVEKEDEVVPGFKIRVKVLNTSELLSAETIVRITDNVPGDIVQKIRGASILSRAILKLNGIDIEKEGMTRDDVLKRRSHLYQQLMQMPAYVIQKAYDLYIEAATDQMNLYSDPKGTAEKVENF